MSFTNQDKLHQNILKDRESYGAMFEPRISSDNLLYPTGVKGPCVSWELGMSLLDSQTLSVMHLNRYGWVEIKLDMIDLAFRYIYI